MRLPRDENDALLAPFLAEADEPARRQYLNDLLVHQAAPWIARALRAEVERNTDAETLADLAAEVNLRLLRKLRRLAADPEEPPIARFNEYVRTVAHSVFHEHQQRTNPFRGRLATRVRYLVSHTPTLTSWGREPVLCGLLEWNGREDVHAVTPVPDLALDSVDDVKQLRSLVVDLIERAGGPVELRSLVDALQTGSLAPERPFLSTAALRSHAEVHDPVAPLADRQYLMLLWREIVELPVRQRIGLLLQLRLADGESVLQMLPLVGVADVRQLAVTLEMTVEQLLALWTDLPLADQRIAEMLGLTRQQVINLRKSARERLSRRMARR